MHNLSIKHILFFLSTGLMAVLMIACQKEGCTDPWSINFSPEAKKDDGSCRKPARWTLTGIDLTLLTDSDEDGVQWDEQGLPDCFFTISAFGTTITSPVFNDVAVGEHIHYDLDPTVSILMEDLAYAVVSIKLHDADPGGSVLMSGGTISFLAAAPRYYSSPYGHTFVNRLPLQNELSDNGYHNSAVQMTAIIDWE